MTKHFINNIFPTPIYTTKIDRKLTKQELKFVNPKVHFNTGGKVLRALANTRR